MVPGGFSGTVGALWLHHEGSQRVVGFFSEERHCNNHLGTVHGGVLMTFADIGLGVAVVDALGGPYCATAQLQIQFVATAPTGAFIICRPEIVRRTSQLFFMRGLITVDDRTVASADGIWKVFEPKPR
jgi:acyl-coenzyme A thioesterase PaaI-like protein